MVRYDSTCTIFNEVIAADPNNTAATMLFGFRTLLNFPFWPTMFFYYYRIGERAARKAKHHHAKRMREYRRKDKGTSFVLPVDLEGDEEESEEDARWRRYTNAAIVLHFLAGFGYGFGVLLVYTMGYAASVNGNYIPHWTTIAIMILLMGHISIYRILRVIEPFSPTRRLLLALFVIPMLVMLCLPYNTCCFGYIPFSAAVVCSGIQTILMFIRDRGWSHKH